MPTIPKNNAFILLFTRLEELAVDKNGQHKARDTETEKPNE